MGEWSVKQKLREAILEAVELGDRVRVEKLLNEGADVDESVGAYLSGNTLLTLAAEKGHVDIAELLIDRGANLYVKINNNTDIEEFVRQKDLGTLADYISRKKELNKRLQDSVRAGDEDGVRSSLTEGADVNLEVTIDQQSCMNLLLLALTEGHIEAAKLLIQHDIRLDYVAKWEDGKTDTALSYAERMAQAEVIQLIKQKKNGETTGEEDQQSSNGCLPQSNDTTNTTSALTSQHTSGLEVTMDDVDADKEFENQENNTPATNSNRSRQKKSSHKSTSCTIT